jgi:DNA polymerase-1
MATWNIDVPTSEYYGPLPYNPRGVVAGDLQALIRELEDPATVEIAIDTETTGLVIYRDYVLYWSLAWGNRRCTLHASLLPYFFHIFADPRKKWILANAKFDMHMLAQMGVTLAGTIWCTQVEHSLLFEEQSHRLKDMAKHLLGWRWSDFQDTFGRLSAKFTPLDSMKKAEEENFPLLVEYAANDAWGTIGVHRDLRPRLEQAETHSLFREVPPYIVTLWDLFSKIEAPYTKVLWKNERNGILVDTEYLGRIGPQAKEEIERLEMKICRDVGWMLNVRSTADLQRYFIDQCRYRPLRLTGGGASGIKKPSMDAGFIEHCAEEYGNPVANMILEHRNLTKLHGTYIEGIHELVDGYCRVHTLFNQDVTRTGRLSSTDPNLQNIPNIEKDKWRLRSAFIAPPGMTLLVHDYNQLEMRLLAAGAREPDMIDIFRRNWDIHMGNASMMMGIPYDELKEAKKIDKEVKEGTMAQHFLTARVLQCLFARAAAKNIGFGLNYGMGPGKLANDLGITKAEAIEKIALYKKTYPAVTRFYDECVATTRQYGYAFTILGRRRNLPGIASSRNDERARAERQCINTEIQGTAADVVKMAQIMLDRAELDRRYGCRALLNVHDELIHECPIETAAEARAEITQWMEQPFFLDLDVALTVAHGEGPNWQNAK